MNPHIQHLISQTNIVPVVASWQNLQAAMANTHLGDFYEWRVDHYQSTSIEPRLKSLHKPIILTVRDPREDGRELTWSVSRRAALYGQYMRLATFVDVETSAATDLQGVILRAQRSGIGVIMSQHEFDKGMWSPHLTKQAAKICHQIGGDIFKTVMCPDSWEQLYQFMACVEELKRKYFPMKIAPMAIGKEFGKASRIIAGMSGSPLVYANLGDAVVEGQWHASEIRDILKQARH